jgi:hypothetical protein
MNHKTLFSVCLHIPVGILTIAGLLVHPFAMLIIGAAFMLYEITELFVINVLSPKEIKDKAYPEIAGFIVGFVWGCIVLYTLFLLGVPLPIM